MCNQNRAFETSQRAFERMSDAKQAIQRKTSGPNAKTIHPVQLIIQHLTLRQPFQRILPYPTLPHLAVLKPS